MINKQIQNLISHLNTRDKEVLRIATNALYFDDSSDYRSALWDIVTEISINTIEDCTSELFKMLNEE